MSGFARRCRSRRTSRYGAIFIAVLVVLPITAVLVVPFAGEAQQAGRMFQIGYLSPGSGTNPQHEVFLRALRELGYVDGSNARFLMRYGEWHVERLRGLADELVRSKVDVIVAVTNPAAVAARQATAEIPIVVMGHDVVGTGLVKGLARPGGNITGLESLAPELDAKRMEILRETLPRARRVALLYNPNDSGMESHLKWTTAAASRLNIATLPFTVMSMDGFAAALEAIADARPDALLVFTDALTFTKRKGIGEFAAKHRTPSFFEFREFVDEGGLVAYGPNSSDLWRRAASYVNRILRGAKPGELPVEQPTTFELVINLRTAKALGLKIPESLLLRASQVIK